MTASPNLARTGVLRSVQALRAGAALCVAAYHALQWGPGGFDVGRAGVDVFFIVSGLIMWRVTAGRDVHPGAFLWRRLARVAPLYWLTTLVVAALAALWPAFLPEVRPGAVHLLLSLAFIPHLDPHGLPFPTLPPGWSLDYEAAFYILFAIALAGPRAWRARVVMGALAAITLAGCYLPDPVYFLGANPMLLQFAAGIGLGWIVEQDALPGRPAGGVMILAALALWTWVEESGVFTELLRPLLWGVPALLLVAGALTLELRSPAKPPPAGDPGPPARSSRSLGLAVTLGDASYAIYLLHLPVTALVAHTVGVRSPWLFTALALAASTLAGLAAHAAVERPLRRRLMAISPPAAWRRGSIRYSPRS